MRFQCTRHNFEPVIWLQQMLLSDKSLDEDILYELSVKREPRGADECESELDSSRKKLRQFVVRNIIKFK